MEGGQVYGIVTDERYQQLLLMRKEEITKLYTVEKGPHDLMDRLIQDLGNKKGEIHKDDLAAVKREVLRIVDPAECDQRFSTGEMSEDSFGLKQYMAERFGKEFSSLFELSKLQTGSVAEGTKVGEPDEFDFIFVLTPKTDIFPLRLTGNFIDEHSNNNTSRTPCEMIIKEEFRNQIAPRFQTNEGILNPRATIDFFEGCLREYFPADTLITQRGPSRNLYLKVEGLNNTCKVDFCLLIEVPQEPVQEFLVARRSGLKNTFSTTVPFHIICCGDIWKISACRSEVKYIGDILDPYYMELYRYLKVLRDLIGVTSDLEDPQLSSYALKTAILYYSLERRDAGPQEKSVYIDLLNILHKVDDVHEGTSALKAFTIENEPIFKEFDTSYLEVRRIALYLKDMEADFQKNGALTTAVALLPILFLISQLLGPADGYINRFSIGVIPLISLGGIVWPVQEKLLSRTKLDKMLKTEKFVFWNQWWLFLFCSLCFMVYVTVGTNILSRLCLVDGYCYIHRNLLYIIPGFMLLHTVVFLIKSRCQLKRYRWQWVFSHYIYYSFILCKLKPKPMIWNSARTKPLKAEILTKEAYCQALSNLKTDKSQLYQASWGKHSNIDSIYNKELQETPSLFSIDPCISSQLLYGLIGPLCQAPPAKPWASNGTEYFTLKCFNHYNRSTKLMECDVVCLIENVDIDIRHKDVTCVNAALMPHAFCDILIRMSDASNTTNQVINVVAVFSWFTEKVKNAFPLAKITKRNAVQTLYFECQQTWCIVKVNLHIGFRLNRERLSGVLVADSWWTNSQHADNFVVLCDQAGWKISPCLLVHNIQNDLELSDKIRLEALKVSLREATVTHDMENTELDITTLTSLTLDHCMSGRPRPDDIYLTTLRIAANIAGDNATGSVVHPDQLQDDVQLITRSSAQCPFIDREYLFKESDRSFLMGRRLAIMGRRLQHDTFKHGLWFSVGLLILLLVSIADILPLIPGVTWGVLTPACCIIKMYISVMGLPRFIGAKFVVKERQGKDKKRSLLYKKSYCLPVYYTVILICAAIEIACFYIFPGRLDTSFSTNIGYTAAIIVITSLPLAFLLTHLILFICLSKCRFVHNRWQWIFIEMLCCKVGVKQADIVDVMHNENRSESNTAFI